MDFLPNEINSLIISYITPNNPRTTLDLESYINLSLVNKEFHHNINKYKLIYKNLKNTLDNDKLNHAKKLEVVKYELRLNTPIKPPATTNEGCLICGNYLPYWYPMMYYDNFYNKDIEKWKNITNSFIEKGLCGHCDNKHIFCKDCNVKYKSNKLSRYKSSYICGYDYLVCSACVIFKKCKWCDREINPMISVKFELGCYSFCSPKCSRFYEDCEFFKEF